MSAPDRINKLKAAMQGMATIAEASPTRGAEPGTLPSTRKSPIAPSRRGKRIVSVYVDALAAKQLRFLGAELDRTTQALVEEALNDLFRKYNKSAVA